MRNILFQLGDRVTVVNSTASYIPPNAKYGVVTDLRNIDVKRVCGVAWYDVNNKLIPTGPLNYYEEWLKPAAPKLVNHRLTPIFSNISLDKWVRES